MDPHDDTRPTGQADGAGYDPPDPPDAETPAAVRGLLAGQPDNGPMSAELARRIDDALLRAADVRSADRELSGELGLVEEPVDDANGDGIELPEASTVPSSSMPAGSPRRIALTRRRWPVLAVAAAAVALTAVAGLTLFGQTRSGTDGLTSVSRPTGAASPTVSVATSVAGRLHLQASGTAYAADTLAAGARALVTNPGPEVAADQDGALGPLATPDGANACVAALGDADAPSVTIDIATYAARPAAIVVIARPDKTTAYAVQRDCATGDPEIIQDSVPVP